MIDPSKLAPERARPLRREEYDRLVDLGAFENEKVELLRGVLVEMTPQNPSHAGTVELLGALLARRIGEHCSVRSQLPLAVSDHSEPEPDIAIVERRDYRKAHPTTAMLVVEVSGASLRKDRELKAQIYAEAGVPEYWVVDLARQSVEVFTEPSAEGYGRSVTAGAQIRPVAFPDVEIATADFLGP